MHTLLTTSAMGLAKLIREKNVSSEDVVKTYIDQAKKVNPYINAIVRDRYEIAIQEAKVVDGQIKAGLDEVPPLLGVPCSIKEMYAVTGMPNTAGLVYRTHTIADRDATVVARLKAAGAIPIGVTNVPVIGLHYESRNKVYGQTNNPYDLSRIPGGSSGGEGAIVSAAGSAFGMGSDIGGSIRMPAFFCGIFGHKSSGSLVPLTGHYVAIDDLDLARYLGFGPLTRYSEDLMPILKIISGPDNYATYVEEMEIGNVEDVDLSKLKYFYIHHTNLHPDVKTAQENALEALRKTGAQIKEIPLGKIKYAFDIFLGSVTTKFPTERAVEILGGGEKVYVSSELIKEVFGRSDLPFYAIINLLLSKIIGTIGKGRAQKFFEMGQLFREEFNDLLGKDGVLIFPTHPFPAIKHGHGVIHYWRTGFTSIFNITYSPVTAIPMGLSREGLPVGIQAVALKGNDHLTIAVARYLESQGYGWIPPKLAE